MTTLAENALCRYVPHDQPAQTAACLDRVAAANALEFGLDALGTLRARNAARSASFRSDSPVAGIHVHEVPRDSSGVAQRARIYRPQGAGDPCDVALVYFHGGGFVAGGLDAVDHQCRVLCRDTGLTVASFTYALAPAAPFPAAVEDALAAISWTRDRLRGADGRPTGIVVAGDSAGGNLAAVASQSLARFPRNNVIGQVLIYPVLDLHSESWSYTTHATTPTLTAERMRWYATQYVGNVSRTDARISPLLTSDLTGVAPALIISAEVDPLLGEAQTYVSALHDSGVDVQHHVFRGLYHGFWNWGLHHDAVQHASSIVVNWLRRFTGVASNRPD